MRAGGWVVVAVALRALGAGAADAPKPALRCETAAKGTHATFEVTVRGGASLTVATADGVATCPLQIRALKSRPKAALAMALALDAAACKPELPDAGAVLADLVLRFEPRGEQRLPRGVAHWLKGQGPGQCAVSAWDRAALDSLAQKRK